MSLVRQVVGEGAKDKMTGSVQKPVLAESGGFQSPVIIDIFTKTASTTKILDC